MNTAATLLLENLGRTTLALALAGVLATIVLRLVRSQWPTAHRLAWVLVLLVGWTFVRLPVAVSWYEPDPVAPTIVELAPADVIADDVISENVIVAELPVIDLAPSAPSPASLAVESSIPPLTPAASSPIPTPPAIVPAVSELPPAKPWHQSIDWPTVVVAAWILGMSLCAAAWLVGYLRFVRLLRDRRPADEASSEAWRELLASTGVLQSIPLSVSERFGPMLCCLPRGYELIVPAELWSELDATGRRAILRHELAHYRRGDVWKSLAARVLALPHWFNPVAWLAVRRFEEAAEWACDRAAIADEPATEYAKLLVHLGQTPHALGYGSSAHGRTLAARVRRVLKGEEQNDSTLKKVSLLLVGLAIVGVSVVQLELVAQEPTETKPPADVESATIAENRGDTQQPADDVVPGKAPEAIPKSNPDTPEQRMINHAKRAFEAHNAGFDAQTIGIGPVLDWSLRWMQAVESMAANQQERVAAARDHVQRMAQLQKKAELLYKVGTKGGEASQLAAANFYLAEAERHLAEVEAPATRRTKSSHLGVSDLPPIDIERELDGAPEGAVSDALLEQMVKQAERAYEAHQAAYEAQTATMQSLHNWSLRWMQVAELAAKNRAERVTAARKHVERTAELQKRIELLFQRGMKGGEAVEYAAANFYLAEAKRHLTEVETQAAANTGKDRVSPVTSHANVDAELQAVDLEIKLAELRGSYEQAKIELKTAENTLSALHVAATRKGGAVSQSELARARGDVDSAKAQLDALKQQIELNEKKLKLLKALEKTAPKPADNQIGGPTPPTRQTGDPNVKPTLLYAGKDFHQWLKILREDLDPSSRAEAIGALAAFAKHGHGREVAEAIVDVFKDYKLITIDGFPMDKIQKAARLAFSPVDSVSTIPVDDALPVVLQALKSDNANQRLFAVVVVQGLADNETVTPLLVEGLKDSDSDIRHQAVRFLITNAPGTPGTLDVVREWVSSKQDPQQLKVALKELGGWTQKISLWPTAQQAAIAPELVRLLDGELDGTGYLSYATTLLLHIGPAAIPALEEGAKSDNKTIREKSQKLLDRLRIEQNEEAPKAETPAK